MSITPLHWLRSGWPLASVTVAFLVGLALGGLGGGVVAAALGGLVFGPAYLINNYIRRRRGMLVGPPPGTPAEKAVSDARLLRVGAIADLALAAVALAVAVSDRGELLPGAEWTALLLIGAAFGVRSAPYLWALADWRAKQRTNRWAWALVGALDLVFGITALGIAIENQRSHWIGGGAWTIALAVLAALWLVGTPGELRRARA